MDVEEEETRRIREVQDGCGGVGDEEDKGRRGYVGRRRTRRGG